MHQLQRIMIRGTMQQLKQEMSKPPGSIPHIMNWVYYGPEGTLFDAITSGRINNRSINSCILAHRWVSMSTGYLLGLACSERCRKRNKGASASCAPALHAGSQVAVA